MKFKIALIGCGRISQVYLDAIQLCPDIQLTAVMDIHKNVADTVGELFDCPAYYDVDTLIQRTEPDGAIICAPPNKHREISCKLMSHGISVLCEKPLATTVEDGLEMLRAAQKNDVTLMMASKFRYVDDVIRARSMIASGALGDVQMYQNQFCGKLDLTNRWNATPSVSGGGVLIDNGTHSLDLVHYLLGPIKKISVQEGVRYGNLPVEESVMISFVTENKVTGTIHLSWSHSTNNDPYINAYGTEGAVKLGWKESFYQQNGHSNWTTFGHGYQKVEAFKKQLENFIQTVNGTSPPLITSEEGLHSLKLIAAAYESLNSGEWVSLNKELVYDLA